MNVRNVLIVPLVLAVLTTPALAKKHNHTDGLNQTGDPCELLTCMAGKLQGIHSQPVRQLISAFSMSGFYPYYNPEATARLRQSILNTCDGAVINKDNLEMIIQRYGRSFQE
jgi:hypothetical protein